MRYFHLLIKRNQKYNLINKMVLVKRLYYTNKIEIIQNINTVLKDFRVLVHPVI
jgi:hypothetical protein